ncbi:MAG TPA: ester cyclase [Usitatibacteraceae bacterium]
MNRRIHLTLTCVTAAALFIMLGPTMSANAADQNSQKSIVMLWYQAFDKHDPALLDKVLSETWADIPPAPNQALGPAGAKQILVELTQAMPDLKIVVLDMLQDGNKVTVRSEISGTHESALMGFPAKGRKLTIQAIDIHELKGGKIVRTWHTEDWLTGLHQLGVFDKQ